MSTTRGKIAGSALLRRARAFRLIAARHSDVLRRSSKSGGDHSGATVKVSSPLRQCGADAGHAGPTAPREIKGNLARLGPRIDERVCRAFDLASPPPEGECRRGSFIFKRTGPFEIGQPVSRGAGRRNGYPTRRPRWCIPARCLKSIASRIAQPLWHILPTPACCANNFARSGLKHSGWRRALGITTQDHTTLLCPAEAGHGCFQGKLPSSRTCRGICY